VGSAVGSSAEETRLGLTSAEALRCRSIPLDSGSAAAAAATGGGGVMRGEKVRREKEGEGEGVYIKDAVVRRCFACIHHPTRLDSTQQLNPTQSTVLTPKPKRTPTTAPTPIPKKNEAHPRGPHSPRRRDHGCALRGCCARPRCRRRSRGQEVSPCWR
jgi:hypothetical protein